MPGAIKQNQTAQPILIGPVILASDHISPATGKTLTVTLSKNGGSFASPAGAVTEIGSGWYKIAGNATDAATLGPLAIHVTEASIDPYDDKYDVVAYDLQDAVRLGLTALPNAAAEASGGLPTLSAAQASNGTINANVHRWLTGTPNALQSGRVDSYIGATAASLSFNLTGSITGSLSGSVGSVTGAVGSVTGNVGGNVVGSVGSVSGAVGSVTGNVGGNVVGSVASVTGNVGGNVNGNVSGSVGSVAGAVGSVTGAVGSVTGNVGGNVVGSTASVAGAVGSVSGSIGGDVSGKVLGGGASAISGDGVRASSVTGAVGSVSGAVGSVTGGVGGNVAGSVASVVAPVAVTSSIKKNQALAGFTFVMIDSSDHVSGKTGLTVTATRSIDGAAFAACANAVAEISGGAYKINLAAADLNGDTVLFKFTATGADTRFVEIVTQP